MSKLNNNLYTGFLNINKEAGFTSFDVVAKLRGILKQKKIGHTGTLDPEAVGVLPVALGRATKAITLLEDHSKEYDACLLLGRETDTYDIWGKTISESSIIPDNNTITRTIMSFTGDQMQIPPMYSAKKVNGKKLYELAREGIIIERKPSPIHISDIKILNIDGNRVDFHINCSKGTYIRSLCHDIGEILGCGGCMCSLKRTRAGQFTLDTAHSLEEIEELISSDNGDGIDSWILPIDSAFKDLPEIFVKEDSTKKAKNGNFLFESDVVKLEAEKNDKFRVYLEKNNFLGIYEKRGNKFYPRKVFIE